MPCIPRALIRYLSSFQTRLVSCICNVTYISVLFQTTADCVQFYYLSKKKENYKDHVIKVKEQKRKAALLARQQLVCFSCVSSV